MNTPTPGVSVSPTCGDTAGCKGSTEAAVDGGAILVALVVVIFILAAVSRKRG
jgi:hypothetical protein